MTSSCDGCHFLHNLRIIFAFPNVRDRIISLKANWINQDIWSLTEAWLSSTSCQTIIFVTFRARLITSKNLGRKQKLITIVYFHSKIPLKIVVFEFLKIVTIAVIVHVLSDARISQPTYTGYLSTIISSSHSPALARRISHFVAAKVHVIIGKHLQCFSEKLEQKVECCIERWIDKIGICRRIVRVKTFR
jgi:hypothetical protein